MQVQSWAGTIAFIVIAQLIRKGTPVGLHPCDGVVHTKWAHGMPCAPETWYTRAMSNQLCRQYGIPVTTASGFCGVAKQFDYQAGVEKSLGISVVGHELEVTSTLCMAVSPASLGTATYCRSLTTTSPDQSVATC